MTAVSGPRAYCALRTIQLVLPSLPRLPMLLVLVSSFGRLCSTYFKHAANNHDLGSPFRLGRSPDLTCSRRDVEPVAQVCGNTVVLWQLRLEVLLLKCI